MLCTWLDVGADAPMDTSSNFSANLIASLRAETGFLLLLFAAVLAGEFPALLAALALLFGFTAGTGGISAEVDGGEGKSPGALALGFDLRSRSATTGAELDGVTATDFAAG